jgi:predicted SprT family Zn-dependent metalloprotease
MPNVTEWTVTLEASLVRALTSAWHHANATHFSGRLASPMFMLTQGRTNLGRWNPSSRILELSRPLVIEQPWGVVLEVLRHEMAHQFVSEVLKVTDETPHGAVFRDLCNRLGIDGRAKGLPTEASDEGTEQARVLQRVARLLALAQSQNQHEAEAAMNAAQRLMLKYNLDLRSAGTTPGYRFRHLGIPTGRVQASDRGLAMVLGKYFFVETIWVPVYVAQTASRGTVLEICGTDANLAIAEYVHGFLYKTAARLWEEHKEKTQISSNRDRRTFLSGVMAGFADKLAQQVATQRTEGLVWVQDGDLTEFYRKRHPSIRYDRCAGPRRTEAYTHGHNAGRNIVLHHGVSAPATTRGRLLPK